MIIIYIFCLWKIQGNFKNMKHFFSERRVFSTQDRSNEIVVCGRPLRYDVTNHDVTNHDATYGINLC